MTITTILNVSGTALEPIFPIKNFNQLDSIGNIEIYLLRVLNMEDLGEVILSNPRIPSRLLRKVIVDEQ